LYLKGQHLAPAQAGQACFAQLGYVNKDILSGSVTQKAITATRIIPGHGAPPHSRQGLQRPATGALRRRSDIATQRALPLFSDGIEKAQTARGAGQQPISQCHQAASALAS
jgi:hypothetical protein